MYPAYYHLSGRPFQLSPDPRFFFGSTSHKKAMAYLTYGLNQGEGFIIITGDIGTGKTTLVGYLLAQLDREKFVAGKVVTTQVDADNTLRMVARAFGIPHEGRDKATLLGELESFFLSNHEAGKRVLLIIDEAQNLPASSLEELRMLSNFQAGDQPLLQCYLLGQPQFRHTLASGQLEQLRQRVIASYHLEPLNAEETRAYIEHRLRRVGWKNDPVFTDQAFRMIYDETGGVPRWINTLCARLLLFGFLEERHEINADVVTEVVRDLDEEKWDGVAETPRATRAAASGDTGAERRKRSKARTPNGQLAELNKRVEVLERYVRAHERTIKRALDLVADYIERRSETEQDTDSARPE